MANILLTGSGGFIGRNLKIYLENKYTLLCPRSFELDLTNNNAVKKYFEQNAIDFIIHCATKGGVRGMPDEQNVLSDNIKMVENLIEYKTANTRVILFGSGAMYDKTKNLHKVKEDEIGKYVPMDLYGKSKMIIAENIKKRSDILMLNIFACYGYGEKETRFPSYAIDCVLKNRTIEINQNCIFDFLFCEDMQKIVYYFIENQPKYNIINITPKDSISLYDIAKIVAKGKVNIIIKNSVMNNEYTGDNSRLLNEIKDFEFTPIEEGLKKLYLYKNGELNFQ